MIDRFALQFILKMAAPFKWHIAVQFFAAIVWALSNSFVPYLIKKIIDQAWLVFVSPDENIRVFLWYIAGYTFFYWFEYFVYRLYDWSMEHTNAPLKKRIGMYLTDHVMKLSHSFYQNNFSGSISSKIENIILRTPKLIQAVFTTYIDQILIICIAIITVYQVDIKFAILLIFWIILFLLFAITQFSKSEKMSNETAESTSGVFGAIVDVLFNIMNVRLFAHASFEHDLLERTMESSKRAEMRRDRFFTRMNTINGLSFLIFQLICLWWLTKGLVNKQVTPGDFALILTINGTIIGQLWRWSREISAFSKDLGTISQSLKTIMVEPEITDCPHAFSLKVESGNIEFHDVSFSYREEEGEAFFNKQSVFIPGGQKVGLVGFSGGGKTTFVNLILRIFDINEGSITIDGQDINHVTQDSLRFSIAMIPQDPSLFHRTIMDNIRYGKINATDEEVYVAAKKAYAHEFIKDLPEKYNTMVGERGIKLSGGQRQRIAFARAILKDSPIIIFDEATSQLDSITESYIQESIQQLMQNKTTLVIAHRLSTLLKMDRILVFDKGVIVQDGTHHVLLKSEGLYKTLWEAQQR